MTITLPLSAEIEQKVREAAARSGVTVEEYIARLVEQSMPTGQTSRPATPEQWEAEWRAWAASHPPVTWFVDDDRDSIYAGRGE